MGKKTGTPHNPRNYQLAPGIMRFSKSRMFQKRGVYNKKKFPVVKKEAKKEDLYVVKKIGGEKNGGERKVLKQKLPRALDPIRPIRKIRKSGKKTKKEKLRPSITPGTVLILLAGRHKGKRVVFLKQLDSGLLMVTGPLKLNNCPIRRIAQCFVIGTQTKLDLSQVNVPDHLTDDYFRRAKKNRKAGNKEDPDIFQTEKEEYQVSDQRKADQKAVDDQILGVIRGHPDKKTLFGYLGSTFSLHKGEYPHNMVF
jgi:large subunit ribosomal protein L6e